MSRIVFFGSAPESRKVLEALVESGHEVVLVVTQPHKRRGRGSQLVPTAVEELAVSKGLRVSYEPSESIPLDAEIGVLFVFGKIINDDVLAARPILNIHPSLLPRWRGAAPIERAILAGDKKTGVCIMKLVKELDAGPLYARSEVTIDEKMTSADLVEILTDKGTAMLLDLLEGELPDPVEQVGEVTYAEKFDRNDFKIVPSDLVRDAMAKIQCGRAFIEIGNKRLVILEAIASKKEVKPGSVEGISIGLDDGSVEMLMVKPGGGREMEASAWLNGASLKGDETFI